MCVAAPVKIIEIDRERSVAIASIAGNVLEVDVRFVTAEVGDYVLVHAGCALEVLERDSAEEILSLLTELEELANDT